MLALFFISLYGTSQPIANYIRNGGFEELNFCGYLGVKYWTSVDTTNKNFATLNKCAGNMPKYSNGDYQWPRSDSGYIGGSYFLPYLQSGRSNIRSKLKSSLKPNATYCVKFYMNVRNRSGSGINSYGAFFGDNFSLDTIQLWSYSLTYLSPQVQNPINNYLTDTLNWVLCTGTFVANGNENNIVLANFKNNASTGTVSLSGDLGGCDVFIDDVSCIDIDLPAYAGPDLYALPGNTVYIGRQGDVGIDEACFWYKLPNTTTAIDTAAGITVTVGAQTATYMVKQDICGNIKYDTVIVYSSAVGLAELKMKSELKIVPNPAQDYIVIKGRSGDLVRIRISDASGRILQEEKILITETEEKLDVTLQNGIYFVTLTDSRKESVTQKLLISK
jgi:hypothetical protein